MGQFRLSLLQHKRAILSQGEMLSSVKSGKGYFTLMENDDCQKNGGLLGSRPPGGSNEGIWFPSSGYIFWLRVEGPEED